ncbi:hypothetical protein [Propionivibrio sp.]|uniref:hypothetical protein n=1 Tax=Propionivibrio sp. TaxID=2212460 RepID=UPI003BF2A7C0
MLNDEQLLSTIPDFMVFGAMMKAIPATEGMDRIIYVEASSEQKDIEGEIVLSKALKDSADYFLKFGIIDMDHKSMPAVAQKMGLIAEEWAIGQPLEVRFSGDKTVVRAKLYSGDTPLAEKANNVWDGLTKLNPPARYYASVGGSVLGREIRLDPLTGDRIPVVTKTRWNNLALSATPVNQHLSTASSAPMGIFAKSLNGYVMKALEASYATDAASLTGGGAFGMQSLDLGIKSYFDFREKLSAAIRSHKTGRDITNYAIRAFGLSHDQASEWVEKFLRGIKQSAANKRQI